MKLTSLSIIFIIIISPFLFITAQQSEGAREDVKLRNYYDTVIDNAVQDAALLLTQNSESISYNKDADISSAKTLAATAFFDSLSHAFNAQGNPSSMARVEACVPILLFLESEGYSIYALNDYKNQKGQAEIRHCWFPMKHYIGETLLNRYSVRYTLENKVYLFDQDDQTLYEGDYEDFKDKIDFFNNPQQFEDLRLTAIKESIEEEFKAYLGEYNKWAQGRSLSVQLNFPRIEDADWKRALADEGILVFAQGFPVIQGKSYQHYALGGARIIRKAPLLGYNYQGQPYYGRTECDYYLTKVLSDPTFNPDHVLYFSDAYEAARNGYYPCQYCRP